MTDRSLWKRKATAFAVRSHRHLWGKNNEDPLSFLHLQGISLDLARSLYLGWNKFGQERPLANWGIAGEGNFLIPPGIVLPHIVEKSPAAVFILPIQTPGPAVMLPGSDPSPVVLGNPDSPAIRETTDLLEGLALLGRHPGDQIRIMIP